MNAIEFQNISKQYRLGQIGTGMISHDLNRWWSRIRGREDPYLRIGEVNDRAHKGQSDYVWALRDINFSVEQGDVVGIIGKNGAGKSTLLKILSKVTAPTTGEIRARGRIASLLEVGTGFHPEMTGRENIYMNGAIMGMTRAEITRKLDEIVDFAGVERYLDTPVKRYSSGMMVRLGFAVAAHLEPEILIVDEVLAVGDAEFQNKAVGKMQEVSRGEGRTVLFVSHNMGSVKNLCKKGIVLNNGLIEFQGSVEDAISKYITQSETNNKRIADAIEWINPDFEITEIRINHSEQNRVELSGVNEMEIEVRGRCLKPKKFALEMFFFDSDNDIIGLYNPALFSGKMYHFGQGDFEITELVRLPESLTKGTFYADIYLTHPNVEYYMKAPRGLIIECQGRNTATGIEINYNKWGAFFLNNEMSVKSTHLR